VFADELRSCLTIVDREITRIHLGTTGRSAPIFKVFEKHPKPGETLATRELPSPSSRLTSGSEDGPLS